MKQEEFTQYKQRVLSLDNKQINILGEIYTIYVYGPKKESAFDNNDSLFGFCSPNCHQIHILDRLDDIRKCPLYPEEWYINDAHETLRHEIIHAFLSESGLNSQSHIPSGSWSNDEEIIDWLAIQSPKIFKVFEELDILNFAPGTRNTYYGND
jgi:hypothetical protein